MVKRRHRRKLAMMMAGSKGHGIMVAIMTRNILVLFYPPSIFVPFQGNPYE